MRTMRGFVLAGGVGVLAGCQTDTTGFGTVCLEGPLVADQAGTMRITVPASPDQKVQAWGCHVDPEAASSSVIVETWLRLGPDWSPFTEVAMAVFHTQTCTLPPLAEGTWRLHYGEQVLRLDVPSEAEGLRCGANQAVDLPARDTGAE